MMHSSNNQGHSSRSRSNTVLLAVLLGCCAIFGSSLMLAQLAPRMAATVVAHPSASTYPTYSLDCGKLDTMRSNWKNVTVSENGAAQFTMSVYNNSDIVSDHISRGAWEEPEVRQVEWALARYALNGTFPTPAFVDIGANVGWFTLIMAHRNYTTYAFEGMATNAHMIGSSLCANPQLAARIHLHHVGLGPAPNRCWIFSGDINVGDGHTMCGIATEAEARARVPDLYALRGDMNITRLDDVLLPRLAPSPSAIPPPLVLKMDVEGFEFEVMKGATQLLSRGMFHYILTEWAPEMLDTASGPTAPRNVLYLIAGLGFAISNKGFAGPFLPPDRVSELANLFKVGQFNLYLVHPNAPTYHTITYMTPAEAGFPALPTGGEVPRALNAAVAEGIKQLQLPLVDQAAPAAAGEPDATGSRRAKLRRRLWLRRLGREA